MKTTAILVFCLAWLASGRAQVETLAGEGFHSGGFGGPVLKITPIRGKAGVLVGGRGGWIINHSFILGGGGYGLVSNIGASTPGPQGQPYVEFGYGGLELEYVHQWDKLMHYSIGLLVGGGGVGYKWEHGSSGESSKGFFTMEPWVNGNLNVTDFFRISAGVSYRWVTGSDSPAASNAELSGVAGILLLRFGSF